MPASTHDWPLNDREDTDVKKALFVGMVACEGCKQVHIDFVDAHGNIFATGSLDFDVWVQVALQTNDQVVAAMGQH